MGHTALALSTAAAGSRWLVRLLAPALTLAVLAGPLAAEGQGAIFRPKHKASFEVRVTAEQETYWQQKGDQYDGCTGEQSRYEESGGQVLSARTPSDHVQELRMLDYGAGPPVAELREPNGKPSRRGLQFEGRTTREHYYKEEIIVPGGESGCGGGIGEETPPEPPDCGSRTFALAGAYLRYAEAYDPNGEELPRNQLLIEPYQFYSDERDDYAPFSNCAFWGPESPGLMSFYDGPLSPRAAFGDKRRLTFEGKTIQREGEDPTYTETTLEWKIKLTRVKKGDN